MTTKKKTALPAQHQQTDQAIQEACMDVCLGMIYVHRTHAALQQEGRMLSTLLAADQWAAMAGKYGALADAALDASCAARRLANAIRDKQCPAAKVRNKRRAAGATKPAKKGAAK